MLFIGICCLMCTRYRCSNRLWSSIGTNLEMRHATCNGSSRWMCWCIKMNGAQWDGCLGVRCAGVSWLYVRVRPQNILCLMLCLFRLYNVLSMEKQKGDCKSYCFGVSISICQKKVYIFTNSSIIHTLTYIALRMFAW